MFKTLLEARQAWEEGYGVLVYGTIADTEAVIIRRNTGPNGTHNYDCFRYFKMDDQWYVSQDWRKATDQVAFAWLVEINSFPCGHVALGDVNDTPKEAAA